MKLVSFCGSIEIAYKLNTNVKNDFKNKINSAFPSHTKKGNVIIKISSYHITKKQKI